MAKEIRFVTGFPALTLGRTLIVTDLHIGIEYRYRKKGIALPSQLERIAKRLDELIEKTGAEKLIILGDIKHRVPGTSFQEEREIPFLFRRLLEKVRVEIAPGNHDDGISGLVPDEVTVHPSSGFRFDDAWFCHGHAWPGKDFLSCSNVIIGHNHSGFEFRDSLGYRWTEPVWVKADLDRKRLEERYGDLDGLDLPKAVLVPPFNEFTGFVALNRVKGKAKEEKGPRPLFKSTVLGSSKVYMLDGTFLGRLSDL